MFSKSFTLVTVLQTVKIIQSETKQHLPKLWAAWRSVSTDIPCPLFSVPQKMHGEEGETITSYAPKNVSKQMSSAESISIGSEEWHLPEKSILPF